MHSEIGTFALGTWQRFKTLAFTAVVSSAFGSCGRGSRITPPLRFARLRHVSLGENVQINAGCWICAIAGPPGDNSIKLKIGSGSEIGMGATISAAASIVLEDNVLLARNVYISDHGHAFEDVSRPIMYQGISKPAPVHVGRNTWLGQNAVILPGVVIGEHCIIGANSVVRGTIPSFSVAVGAPARVVKRFNTETSRWEATS